MDTTTIIIVVVIGVLGLIFFMKDSIMNVIDDLMKSIGIKGKDQDVGIPKMNS